MLTRGLQLSVNALPWKLRLALKHVPGVASVQRWLVDAVLSRRTFLHAINRGPAKGLRYPVVLPIDKGVWTGTYEWDFAARIAASIAPGAICYDVGSYRGFLAGVIALAGGHVYAFEPLPVNCRQIEAMIAANPGLRISLLQVALGNDVGVARFRILSDSSMGKLTSSEFRPEDTGLEMVEVRVSTVDELVLTGQLPPPQLMKIDVEGAEAMVLAGARRVLAKYQPALFIEAHSAQLAQQCRFELSQYGYRIQALNPETETRASPGAEVSHMVCTPA